MEGALQKTSVPLFHIGEIKSKIEGLLGPAQYYRTHFDAYIDILNSEGKIWRRYTLSARSNGVSGEETVRQCIEQVLNKKIHPQIQYYNVDMDLRVDYTKMHYSFKDLPEPWRKLFTDLFTGNNWTIVKMIDAPMLELKQGATL